MTDKKYQIVQFKSKKMYIIGAGFTSKREAMDFLISRQRDGMRGMRIVLTRPYATGMREVVEV